MAEPVVTVGKYTDAMAANLAHAHLQAEGIRATLTGDMPSMFPGNVALTQYQLQVAESDRKRALEVLFDHEQEELDPDWEANIETEGGWLCSLCGSALKDGEEICPDCLTERGPIRAGKPTRPTAPFPVTPGNSTNALQKEEPVPTTPSHRHQPTPPDQEIDVPDEDELRADSAMARRALYASILGCVGSFLATYTFFVTYFLTIYSIYLLIKIANLQGNLTPRAKRQVWLAVAFNIVPCGVLIFFTSGLIQIILSLSR